MKLIAASVLVLAAAPLLTSAETVHGVVIFTRHGDRTSKFYKGYQMTNLGATQVYASGSAYRERYVADGAAHQILNISADVYRPSQLWASAPDQSVLLQTATNFLQGLYPPLGQLDSSLATETLTNGTSTESPLGGYQFVQIHGESEEEPDTIWIKGDDFCPAYEDASASYEDSAAYQEILNSTQEFYSQFAAPLANILPADKVSYARAYDVFDLLNVGHIHNASVASTVTAEQVDQLRYLADEWEWNHNYNQTQPKRSIGGMALSGGILRQLNATVSGKGKLKLSLMAGSYDTFLSFFGLTNLSAYSPDFMGIPDYASSMAFELFTEDNLTSFPADESSLRIRYLFQNGTSETSALTAYPLFEGYGLTMSYADFVDTLSQRSIRNVSQWCSVCQSTDGFCQQEQYAGPRSRDDNSSSGLTVEQAGVIGAMVIIAVALLIGGLGFLMSRMKAAGSPAAALEQRVSASDSEPESLPKV